MSSETSQEDTKRSGANACSAMLCVLMLLAVVAGCEPAKKNPNTRFTIVLSSNWKTATGDCYRYEREGRSYVMYDQRNNVIGECTAGEGWSVAVKRNH
jgi:hypothetical protein